IVIGSVSFPSTLTFSLIFAPFGALSRFGLGKWLNQKSNRFFWGTFSTNVVGTERDRKSTRLNSSHVSISYAVFCLKKKTTLRLMKNRAANTPASGQLSPERKDP